MLPLDGSDNNKVSSNQLLTINTVSFLRFDTPGVPSSRNPCVNTSSTFELVKCIKRLCIIHWTNSVPYILDQLCFIHWTNSGPILRFIHWTNSVPYTLDQLCFIHWTNSVPILRFIHWTNSVLYTLDQFRALYIGPIPCFIHRTNSVLYTLDKFEGAASVNTRFP